MVDAVQSSQTNVTPLQRLQPTVVASKKPNTVLAQSVIDKTQSIFAAVKSTNTLSQSSKPAGFSTNLPRGSLVDEIV